MEWLSGHKDPRSLLAHKHSFRVERVTLVRYNNPWLDFRCRSCGERCTTDRTILYAEMTGER